TSGNYLNAAPLFTAGRVRILDLKRLIAQFAGLERRTTIVGRDRVDHGSGDRHHDDLSAACAGALVMAAGKKRDFPLKELFAASLVRDRYAKNWHGPGGNVRSIGQRYGRQ